MKFNCGQIAQQQAFLMCVLIRQQLQSTQTSRSAAMYFYSLLLLSFIVVVVVLFLGVGQGKSVYSFESSKLILGLEAN